jgi:hypothetical protein
VGDGVGQVEAEDDGLLEEPVALLKVGTLVGAPEKFFNTVVVEPTAETWVT